MSKKSFMCFYSSEKKEASPFSTLMTLSAAILGTGMLGMPYAFDNAGLCFATGLLIAMSVMSYIVMYFISYAADATCLYTYSAVSYLYTFSFVLLFLLFPSFSFFRLQLDYLARLAFLLPLLLRFSNVLVFSGLYMLLLLITSSPLFVPFNLWIWILSPFISL
jgi:amino acid permease